MPFVQTRLTNKLNDIEKSKLHSAIEEIIKEELQKPVDYIMVGIEDGYNLWLGDNKLENGAMISVQHMGIPSKDAYNAITKRISKVLEDEFQTDSSKVYITFQCINEWGWSGSLL